MTSFEKLFTTTTSRDLERRQVELRNEADLVEPESTELSVGDLAYIERIIIERLESRIASVVSSHSSSVFSDEDRERATRNYNKVAQLLANVRAAKLDLEETLGLTA